jgi:FlaA1/EpsC-like NDP-sugar epimerase
MLNSWLRSRSRLMAILHDILIIPVAWFSAFWLRFNLDGIPEEALLTAIEQLPIVMLVQAATYWGVGLYRGIWRFASIPDLMRILRAVLIGCTVFLIILFFTTRLQGLPRSVLPIYAMLLVIFLGGSRFTVRWLKDHKSWIRVSKRVLVVGADQAGEGIVRDLLRDKERNYKPIAFVDDRVSKLGQEIHGIRVVGRSVDIPHIVKEYNIQLIIIAMPSARAEEMRRMVQYCEGTECLVRTLPGLNALVSGQVSIDLLREVSLEDLLGRDPVSLDWKEINNTISNKKILITGGGGSIGSELCRQVARLKPALLVVVERSEYNLFMLEQEFKEYFPDIKIANHLIDVSDSPGMNQIFTHYQPEIIFHAAAYKHVPLLETQPREAINNNILGTRCLAQLALAHGVEKFILVSTDKAVNPTNIMGASKRASEMVCHCLNGSGSTQFITVRFGNVLGSAGSVVPIFRQQLEKGGPITVTHPDITRFFMTIPEACQLILQALSIGKGGEIFVLDMGEPIKIQFLAEQMIHLAGKKLGEDIEIRYTGLRPGEKLYEELFHANETLQSTVHQKIFQAQARKLNWVGLTKVLDEMEEAVAKYDEGHLKNLLQQLVPELEIQNTNPLETKVNTETQVSK